MFPDVFNIPIPDSLAKLAPSDYKSFNNHLERVRDDRQWTEEKEKRLQKKMEWEKKKHKEHKEHNTMTIENIEVN